MKASAPNPPSPVPAELPFLLDARDLATLLRTTRKAIYAMIERGQLAGVIRIGRRVLVRRDDLLSSLSSSDPSSLKARE